MATMTVTFAGETHKYTAELWNYALDTKLADVPLDEPYIASGGGRYDANYILFKPVAEEIVFDRFTSNVSLKKPWEPGPTIRNVDASLNPLPDGVRAMFLDDSLLSNVGNSPTFELFYIGEVVTITPFNRLHLMGPDALEDFSEVRLIETDEEGNEVFNFTIYIVNLLSLGFELPESSIAGNSNIRLGELDTQIDTPLFSTDKVTVDLGQIEVPVSNSSLDYLSNTFELFLPFVESPIDIKPDFCVGKTVHVEYIVDLYTGDTTINLYNGGEIPFNSVKTTIGRNIPTKLVGETNYSIVGTNGVANNVLSAYIRHTKPELIEGQFYNLVSKAGIIGSFKGYLEVDSMELQGKALADEKSQILAILRNGVIVK